MNATMVASGTKAVPSVVSSIQDIPLGKIRESKTNPRRFFDEAKLTFYWKYEMYMDGPETSRVRPQRREHPEIDIRVNAKPILAYSKGQALPPNSTITMFRSGGRDKRYHRWGQDVVSARYCITSFSRPGDLVLDPFIGGGTTAVACEQLGRRWICGDLDSMALATTAKRLKPTNTQSVVSHRFAYSP